MIVIVVTIVRIVITFSLEMAPVLGLRQQVMSLPTKGGRTGRGAVGGCSLHEGSKQAAKIQGLGSTDLMAYSTTTIAIAFIASTILDAYTTSLLKQN